MKNNGIAVIGRVAKGTELLDGQTVKTRVLVRELEQSFPNQQILCVDTYRYSRRFLPILWDTFRAFRKSGHIFVLLSRYGRTFFFPLLTGLNKLFRRRMYHDVVGGALPGEAKERPALVRQLRRFTVNWVEFDQMRQELNSLNIYNVEVLPNFKRLNLLSPEQLPTDSQPPFLFSMFSRVTKTKGITAAAEAMEEVNRHYGKDIAFLKVYGPVEEDYRQEFEELLARCPHTQYMGCIPQEQSVEALRSSFMLLFPSVYPGEGMPGTVLDAFSAGLPVIATDWHFNSQLVRHGVTGWCYHWEAPQELTRWIIHAIDHPQQVDAMRPACLEEAKKYTPEQVMGQILRKMSE